MPSSRSHITLLCAAVAAALLLLMSLAAPASAGRSKSRGGATFEPPPPPPEEATLVDGRVIAPASAPRRVKRVIEAANRLVEKPYVYGGGHKPFSSTLDSGYDCSGAVSYALYGGRFLRSPLPSGALMSWGEEGPGDWITVYAHGGHAYIVVAGLRFDTSLRDPDAPGPSTGPRWSRTLRESDAFVARHPYGY
jgi:cell wall-associated NlpC family hydrolase